MDVWEEIEMQYRDTVEIVVPPGVIELLAFYRRCDNEAMVAADDDMEYESTLSCGGCSECGRL